MAHKRLSRQEMCNRLAMEFQDGWVVNLGIGTPTLCSNYDFGEKEIVFHSENGVIGYGPLATNREVDADLVNAGAQPITLKPGAAIVHHADSFSIIRAGYIDAAVLGAYEVAENGDFANWKTANRMGGGIGGAMDLAVGAKRVFIAMPHTTSGGLPRMRKRCGLDITAAGVVNLIVTDLALFEITPDGFLIKEIAPGYTTDDIQALTNADIVVSATLREFTFVEDPH
jgi:3-oxoacid CoA-transferase B subunit